MLLEKHLKMKLKEIRPLHLDDKLETKAQVLNLVKSAKRKHTLRFYDNRPLKRFTGLFSRSTQIQIKELENADIDIFSSVQLKGRNAVGGVQPIESQVEQSGTDKLFAEYLGINGGDEDLSAMNIVE